MRTFLETMPFVNAEHRLDSSVCGEAARIERLAHSAGYLSALNPPKSLMLSESTE